MYVSYAHARELSSFPEKIISLDNILPAWNYIDVNITSEDYARLLRRCLQLTCNDLKAEDLAQDVCLKALQLERDGKVKGGSSVSTLLCGIAGNVNMNNNTVEYGRGIKPGRIRLMSQYATECKRLHDSSVQKNISEIFWPSVDNVLVVS